MFGSRKLNERIDFAVDGLDLSKYVITAQNGEKVIYDLYAVSNHFGNMHGGHYTAYAKSPVYKKWFEFDDTNVSNLNPSTIVTKAAYVLFYRLRKEK